MTQQTLFQMTTERQHTTQRKSEKVALDADSIFGEMRQIPDGPTVYPDSCVMYVRFRSYPIRQLFAYLREKERFYQQDVKRWQGFQMEFAARARLEEVEAQLCWMAANIIPGRKQEKRTNGKENTNKDWA